jgi:hypothetical protein
MDVGLRCNYFTYNCRGDSVVVTGASIVSIAHGVLILHGDEVPTTLDAMTVYVVRLV